MKLEWVVDVVSFERERESKEIKVSREKEWKK